MARSVADINTQILTSLVANFATIGITFDPTKWSKRNFTRQMCYTFAICAAFIEQLMDTQKSYVENQVLLSTAATGLWIQSQMFKFQYSESTPQILTIINGVPTYPVIDNTLNVITACFVASYEQNSVTIKIATGNPLTKVSDAAIAAANGYATLIGSEGISYIVTSANADQIYLNATIYFQKQYYSTILATLITAINNYYNQLSSINLNGVLKVSDIEELIKYIDGVNDIVINEMYARADITPFNQASKLVTNSQTIQRNWSAVSGYYISETTTGKTLTDNLILIGE